VGALGLGIQQRVLRARDAQHVAEAGEDHTVVASDRDAVIDPTHRYHAHGAAGAMDELDVLGQQVVDSVLVDRVRVAAADLHHLVVAAGLERSEDLAGDGPPDLGVAELVDEPHAAGSSRAIAVPAWTSRRSAGATGATRAVSTVSRRPSS